MEQILDAPVSDKRNFRYAGFWIRVGASIIDAILLSIIQLTVAFTVFGGYFAAGASVAYNAFSIVLGIVYYCGMESSQKQATLGKIAVRIKVGNERGERISFLNALGRYLSKLISALILFIGFIMVGFDSKKQGLHDKIASTYVFED